MRILESFLDQVISVPWTSIDQNGSLKWGKVIREREMSMIYPKQLNTTTFPIYPKHICDFLPPLKLNIWTM